MRTNYWFGLRRQRCQSRLDGENKDREAKLSFISRYADSNNPDFVPGETRCPEGGKHYAAGVSPKIEGGVKK